MSLSNDPRGTIHFQIAEAERRIAEIGESSSPDEAMLILDEQWLSCDRCFKCYFRFERLELRLRYHFTLAKPELPESGVEG